MSYFVYIIRSARDGSYYVGATQDIEERLIRHNQAGRSIRRTEVLGRLYIRRNIQKEAMLLSVRMLSRTAKAVIT
ncbi:MAG: GIY-YIG nuclease family protein [Desulfobacterales bacterium]|uniref:GIY-YIG nuclease family protein n=1 Tax=Candidatus Desulfatibia vada TaxID=2841696 RepID=A0A8J6NT13_9BACT|nr:GIY-YIG nuclease family protein [Candidatus Desulfatibia vada]